MRFPSTWLFWIPTIQNGKHGSQIVWARPDTPRPTSRGSPGTRRARVVGLYRSCGGTRKVAVGAWGPCVGDPKGSGPTPSPLRGENDELRTAWAE